MKHSTRRNRVRSTRRNVSTKRRSLSAKNNRNNFRRSKRDGNVYHFTERVDGGTINSGNGAGNNSFNNSGGLILRLTDLPMYQQMSSNFEFARLNKCKIEFLPKFNMSVNALTTGSGALATGSITGTFLTAIDQIPFYTANVGAYATALTWTPDTSVATGVTNASFVQIDMSPNYIRGLERSKEKELYKKQSFSFYPAFYDYIMTGQGTGAITNVENPILSSTAIAGATFGTTGCVERKLKKWISIKNFVGTLGTTNVGPLYFGPVYSMDINVPGTTASVPLYDVRLTYSISFKRYNGVT